MSENIKALIKLHILIYICFIVSSLGLYIVNKELSLICISTFTITTPLSLIASTIYIALKESRNA